MGGAASRALSAFTVAAVYAFRKCAGPVKAAKVLPKILVELFLVFKTGKECALGKC